MSSTPIDEKFSNSSTFGNAESIPPKKKNENNFKIDAKKEKMPIYMFPDSTLFGDSQLLVQQKQEKRASVDEEAPRRSTREQT
uniref:Uncharacterized protein n=1 Tax=Romanomermis culicivorax TaxID=13658 RepID=A0A915K341_ROMCU